VNGVAFEEWKITLPQELTFAQNKALMEDLVQAIAGETLPITYAFHNPQTLEVPASSLTSICSCPHGRRMTSPGPRRNTFAAITPTIPTVEAPRSRR